MKLNDQVQLSTHPFDKTIIHAGTILAIVNPMENPFDAMARQGVAWSQYLFRFTTGHRSEETYLVAVPKGHGKPWVYWVNGDKLEPAP